MKIVSYIQQTFMITDARNLGYSKDYYSPISADDLFKKNPLKLLLTSEAIDQLNNCLGMTVVNGEWQKMGVEYD